MSMSDESNDRAMWWVYRLTTRPGDVLYVGMTNDHVWRFKQHKRYSAWWPKVSTFRLKGPFLTREDARRCEVKEIRRYEPPYNQKDIPRRNKPAKPVARKHGAGKRTYRYFGENFA